MEVVLTKTKQSIGDNNSAYAELSINVDEQWKGFHFSSSTSVVLVARRVLVLG